MVKKKTIGIIGGTTSLAIIVASYLLLHPGADPTKICYCPLDNKTYYFEGGVDAANVGHLKEGSNKTSDVATCKKGKAQKRFVCCDKTNFDCGLLMTPSECNTVAIDQNQEAWC